MVRNRVRLNGVDGWVVGRVWCVVCGVWCVMIRVRFKIKEDLLYGKLVQDEKKHSD